MKSVLKQDAEGNIWTLGKEVPGGCLYFQCTQGTVRGP
jgi:hypothetical protein